MKSSSAVLIAIAAAAGIGIAALLLLKRPGGAIHIGGGGNSVGNTFENCTVNNYASAPAQMQRVQRLPRINNGDDVQTITSYIPGGY